MSARSLIVNKVLDALREVYDRHKTCRHAILNDVSVAIYGLVKPIEEVRVLVDSACSTELLYTLLRAFNVEEHYADALEKLKEQGIVAVSTRFYPLIVVELSRTSLDRLILDSVVDVKIDDVQFRMPRLEHLVVKLISIGLYPYTAYAYTLIVAWIKQINIDEIFSVLDMAGIDPEQLARKLESMYALSLSLPHVRDEFERIMALVHGLRRKKS